jgi:hypothetical protein
VNKIGVKFVLASGALFEESVAKEITIEGINISVAPVRVV